MISWKLYLHEWRENGFYWLLMIVGTIAVKVLMNFGLFPEELFSFPLILSIFAYGILCTSPLAKERKNNTIYIKKSLPVPGYVHLLVKIGWLMSSYVLYLVFWCALYFRFIVGEGDTVFLFSDTGIFEAAFFLLAPFFGIVLMQFSYLIANYVAKFRSAFSFWAFVLTFYLVIRIVPLVAKVFEFLPDFAIAGTSGSYVSSGFILAVLAVSVALLFINGKLWDNEPAI